MTHDEHRPVLLISEAARVLAVCADTLRRWDSRGILRAARTSRGVRVFDEGAVRQLAAQRAADRRRP
jgi:DNA-binding transcriptional MerR regulator